ncbi:MAG: hypothetical protein RLZ98_1106 [Pseudomonadota bacterium]|jgi:DNA repair exonuclease SbcCD nuclease subunit
MTASKPYSAIRDLLIAHASDVHVDNDYTARLFGGDGTGGLQAVLAAAASAGADVVLLAGDTFDSHRQLESVIERAAAVIREFALPIVVLPGNHDPAVDEAVYHRPALAKLDNLSVLGVTHNCAVHMPEFDLEVWGNAHRDYFDMDPLAEVLARRVRWHVAMAHGHYVPEPDRSTNARPSWLFGDEDIRSTGADYLALGHWNRRVQVGCGAVTAWYSGSPDYARSINMVRLSGDKPAEVSRVALELPEDFGAGILD